MKDKKESAKIPIEIVLNVLNNEQNADVKLLDFYAPYIGSIGTVEEDDITYVDEDLIQEIKIAVIKAIPKLRKALLNKHFKDDPIVMVVATY